MNRSYIKTSRTPEIIFASVFLSICLRKCVKPTVLIRRKKGFALCFLMIPCLVLLQIGCGGGGSSGGNGDTAANSNPRSFHLGFTPFPYDISQEAESRDFVFIINFVLRDYDALWEKIGRTDLAAVWRDTGLYDENGLSRPALQAWQTALTREHNGNYPNI